MIKLLCWIILCSSLTILASGQDHYLPIKPSIITSGGKKVICVQKIGLSISCDSDLNTRYLKYSTKTENYVNQKIIDSVGCSPYSSDLIVYKTQKGSDYLILWTTDSEYYSDIEIYYLNNDILTKVGPLLIRNDCETCDDTIYPVKWLNIFELNDHIVFEPIKPFKYNLKSGDWQRIKPKEMIISIDKNSRALNIARTNKQ
jgi:hypothetical protein